MARFADPQLQPFYAAAARFVDAALRHDDSLFTTGRPIWSLENLNRLHHDYVEQPDTSEGTFLDKLRDQLAHSDPATIQLMGEMLYVHLLPANGIRPDTKRKQVNTVLQWSSEPVRMPAELEKGLDHGVAKASQAYLNLKWVQLAFLITFARAWKQLSQDERERALADSWEFKRIVWNIPMQTAYAQREILLYLVFPDTFEPTFSREHKALLTKYFNDLADPAEEDIDRRILAIRRKLEPQYGEGFTFYQPELKPLWLDGKPPLPPSGPLPHTLGPRLRPYVELITHLSGSSYTPEQIVEPLGRVSPRIAPDLTAAPDADALVQDLMHLRLVKTTQKGYRRWSHLDDASADDLLRYAALTLLVPLPDGGYDLPAARAPFDGQPHPASAWPYGEALLQWYAEAGLAEQNDDGTWQSLPGALEPLEAETASAKALNTFLQYLHQVREQQGNLPPVADAPLPLLDPDTLDERIAEIQRELLVDRATILRIYRALIAGQHVILSGPPGTGKTHLATLLPRVLWRDLDTSRILTMPTDPRLPPTTPPIEQPIERHGYAVEVVTATEDWGVRHVIGGIAPQLLNNGQQRTLVYRVQHGHLTRAVLANYQGYNGEDVPTAATLAARRSAMAQRATVGAG